MALIRASVIFRVAGGCFLIFSGLLTAVFAASEVLPPTVASGTNWNNANNVLTDNGTYSTYSNSTQDYLKLTGFGFVLAQAESVLGITVRVNGLGAIGISTRREIYVVLTKNGSTASGTPVLITQGTSDGDRTAGGAADLWGVSWDPDDIRNSNFGVIIYDANTGTNTISIDYVEVTVTTSLSRRTMIIM